MVFVEERRQDGWCTVDGYSRYKTIEAAARDMGRYIARYVSKEEGELIIQYSNETDIWRLGKDSCGGYFMEAEEVPCATIYDEEKEEMKYADANWYICARVAMA